MMNNHFDYVALGSRIRSVRKQRHLTQEKLAEACNLSTAHIGHIERGTRALSIESLITLANVLSVSTDYLLLDVSTTADKNFLAILNVINSIPEKKRNTLYHIMKILAENVDNL